MTDTNKRAMTIPTLATLRAKYGKPEYRTFADATEQWEEFKRQACAVETVAELRRHAGVSTDNAHYCHSCFTCACVFVLNEVQGR